MKTVRASAGVPLDQLVSRLPAMSDGTPILLGDEVWVAMEDYPEWPYTRATKVTVDALYAGRQFEAYRGKFTVGAVQWEGGNEECYRTREEVPGCDDC